MEKTICAISTGMTPSGIAIIRMSGEEAIRIADTIFQGKRPLSKAKTHTIHYGHIVIGGATVDEVLVSVMRAPHTFTGEDVVEINSHGGILVSKKIMEGLMEAGAWPAEPGEFTKRAFLNGRMDLSQAEGVMEIISAKNQFALKAGISSVSGKTKQKITQLREAILDECAFIEAAIDDPEHYDLEGYREILHEHLQPVEKEIASLIARSEYGTMLSEGIRTVICGRPNAGKSSLLNLLSGTDRAIVTDIEGTTRDVLEVTVNLENLSLILMDTAGLRDTSDVVEKIGVDRAVSAAENADLILYVIDGTKGLSSEDRENIARFQGKPVVFLWNKADIAPEFGDTEQELLELGYSDGVKLLPISCLTGDGQKELEQAILSLFHANEITFNDELIITSERQKHLLKNAQEALTLVENGIEEEYSEEFLTIDLVNCYTALGEIIGEEVTDDVVNRVFEKFCMGK